MLDEADCPSFSVLDYRFGWRWLLPVLNGDRIFSVGLNADEQQWWAQTQSFTLVSNQVENFDGCLISLDSVAPDAIANQINSAKPRWLCIWGSSSSVNRLRLSLHGFDSIREYGLLPAEKPRVVVPMSSPQNAVAGLRMHRPGRWLARVGLMVACIFARLGYYGLVRRSVLLVATREKKAISQGAVQAGMNASMVSEFADYALYLGTPDGNRKTIVLPVGDSPSSIVLKVAETPRARASLMNEASALSALSQSPLASCVPKLEDLISSNATLTLRQEYRSRRSVSQRKLDAAVINFLGQLMALNHQSTPLSAYLQVLPDDSEECIADDVISACRALHGKLQNQSELNAEILLHRTHGDFAPWNCIWSNQGLFVFDWEESEADGLALQDAFYYIIAPALLVQRNASVTETFNTVFCFANRVVEASGTKLDIQLYFALWLLARAGRAKLYGELCVLLAQRWQ